MVMTEVTVEVFGDPGGSEEMNLALGERRTNYLKNLLAQRCSAQLQIRTVSYGMSRPPPEASEGQVRILLGKE
jgi:outer membrane protein OmpA-like peptidoglycan-associated protein